MREGLEAKGANAQEVERRMKDISCTLEPTWIDLSRATVEIGEDMRNTGKRKAQG